MRQKSKEMQNQIQFDNYKQEPVQLGPYTSHIWKNDPKHLGFLLARYKFCAKMLQGKGDVLEIGCGDAFGTPIVAQMVGSVHGVDWEPLLLEDNAKRLRHFKNCSFSELDITKKSTKAKHDAAFCLDVIEHIPLEREHLFMSNICKSIKSDAICIIGTPNITAGEYATKESREGHVNLKSHSNLRELLGRYFVNVFLFSMNDEVVHTGYYPMAHYLIGVGVGKSNGK